MQSGKCLPCLSHVHPYYNPIWAPFVICRRKQPILKRWSDLSSLAVVEDGAVGAQIRFQDVLNHVLSPTLSFSLLNLLTVDIPPMQRGFFGEDVFTLHRISAFLRWFGERNPTGETQHRGAVLMFLLNCESKTSRPTSLNFSRSVRKTWISYISSYETRFKKGGDLTRSWWFKKVKFGDYKWVKTLSCIISWIMIANRLTYYQAFTNATCPAYWQCTGIFPRKSQKSTTLHRAVEGLGPFHFLASGMYQQIMAIKM